MENLLQTNQRLRRRLIRLAGMVRSARYSAEHDVLTGLPNRRLLYDRLRHAMEMASRYNHEVAVLMLDLDDFKAINDELGHERGDQLLKCVAERLSGSLRTTDIACRLGGDEFVIVLSEVESQQEINPVVAKIRRVLAEPYQLGQEMIPVGISIGVAVYKGEAMEPQTLIAWADRAMYIDKACRHVQARELGDASLGAREAWQSPTW